MVNLALQLYMHHNIYFVMPDMYRIYHSTNFRFHVFVLFFYAYGSFQAKWREQKWCGSEKWTIPFYFLNLTNQNCPWLQSLIRYSKEIFCYYFKQAFFFFGNQYFYGCSNVRIQISNCHMCQFLQPLVKSHQGR